MQQNRVSHSASAGNIANYLTKACSQSQQETLGQLVVEILMSGKNLNRKALCSKLLTRLEAATSAEEEAHYQALIGLLFDR